jgi:hypothetical protein
MDFRRLRKLGMKTLAFVLAVIMAVPVLVFVSTPEEAYADLTAEWGLWTSGRRSVEVNGLRAEVVAWNPRGTTVEFDHGYTAATIPAGFGAVADRVPHRSMIVRVTDTGLYRWQTTTPDLGIEGRTTQEVTGAGAALLGDASFILYARASTGGLATVASSPNNGTQLRDRGPMTSIANLGTDGQTIADPHNADAWLDMTGQIVPMSVDGGTGVMYVRIGFPDTVAAVAAGTNRNIRTHTSDLAWNFNANVLGNPTPAAGGNIRLYMGMVTDTPFSTSNATQTLANSSAQAGGGTGNPGVGNARGFITSGGNPNILNRNNMLSINGLVIRAEHARQSPNASSLLYRIEGAATQPGTYQVWFTQNGAMFGNGRANTAIHAVPGAATLSDANNRVGPWSTMPVPLTTVAMEAGDIIGLVTGALPSAFSHPTQSVLRAEFGPFPSLGDRIVRNGGVAMNATGALNTPAYQVRLGLTGPATVAGNHRVTVSNIPASYLATGQTVLTNTTAATAERPAFATAALARRIEWIVPVVPGAVNRSTAFNLQIPGTAVTRARADAITGLLNLHHEFFPNVTLANATVNGVIAGGSVTLPDTSVATSTAIFNPDTGQIRVTVPITGNATVAGRYNVTLTSTNTALNSYLSTDVRSFQQSAGAIPTSGAGTRVLTWNIAHEAVNVDVASLGFAVTLTAETEAPPVPIGTASNNSLVATGTARVGADQTNISTVMSGNPTVAGSYRVRVLLDGVEVDSRTFRATANDTSIAGRTFMTSIDNPTGLTTANSPTEAPARLSLDITFIPIISATPVNGVNAVGNISVFDDGGIVSVALTGTVGIEGFYRVTLTGSGFTMAAGAPNFQMERFSLGANANRTMGFDIVITDMNLFASTVGLALIHDQGDIFFYAINYVDETISFGNGFSIFERPLFSAPDARGRRTLEMYNGLPVYEVLETPIDGILRQEITFIFNRRADRIDVTRGNWSRTGTGNPEFSRQIRRGGFVGVRRALPSGGHELIAIIPLDARPCNRAIRAHRRTVFQAPILQPGNSIETTGHFHNPEPVDGATLEIRIGQDRRNPHLGYLATERLAPGGIHPMPHDLLPRGSRGTYRVAPTDVENFVLYDGTMWAVRDILAMYRRTNYLAYPAAPVVPVCDDGEPIVLGEGNFGSMIVRFRIPNAPNAPAVARMTMTPGRNGQPFFISGTNQNMFVNVGTRDIYEAGVFVRTVTEWEPLARNIQLGAFLGLFVPRAEDAADNITRVLPTTRDVTTSTTTDGVTTTTTTTVRDFEIRMLRLGRVQSAPGFLTLSVDAMDANLVASARVNPVLVEGVAMNQDLRAPLNRTGTRVIIDTTNAIVTGVQRNQVVGGADAPADDNWFPNLPAGLEARITALSAGNSRITVTIRGIAEVGSTDAIEIVIPADRGFGPAPFPVANVPVPTGDPVVYLAPARFNIGGDARPIAQSITNPSVDVTFANAEAGTWGLPTQVEVVTQNPDGSAGTPVQAAVVWQAVTGFDATNTGAQTASAIGEVAALPNTVAPGSIVLPATVTVTINVAAQ